MRIWSLGLLLSVATPCAAADIPLEEPEKHGGYFAFAFSPDGRLVAGGTAAIETGSRGQRSVYGGEVLLWDARTGELLRTLGSHGKTVDWVAFADGGARVFSGSRENGLVQAWSTGGGPAAIRIESGTQTSRRVSPVVSSDGRTVALVTEQELRIRGRYVRRETPLRVLDTRTGTTRWTVEGPDVRALAMDPRGKLLAVYLKQNWKNNQKTRLLGRAAKQTIELRDLTTGRVVHRIADAWTVNALTFLPDGRTLAAVTDRELIRWSTKTGAELDRFSVTGTKTPRGLTYSSRGDAFAVPRFMGDRIELWAHSGKALGAWTDPDCAWWPAFSPQLDRMACKKGARPVVVDLTQLPTPR